MPMDHRRLGLPSIDKKPEETWTAWAARDRLRYCMAIIARRAEIHAHRWDGGVG